MTVHVIKAGFRGLQGVPGPVLTIKDTLPNIAALLGDAVEGDVWLIAGDQHVRTDDGWENTGPVQGPAGRGIVAWSHDADTGVLTLTFTDSAIFMTGDLRGGRGNDGRGISGQSYDPETGVLTLSFTDGTSYQTPDLRGGPGEAGRGIAEESYDAASGILTLSFSDGSTYQTQDLRGPAPPVVVTATLPASPDPSTFYVVTG